MQLKLYKKSTIFLSLVVLADIIGVVLMLKFRTAFADKKLLVTLLFVLFIFILSSVYSYYDINADKIIIRKRVSNGDVALAKIKSGTFVRFGRDAKLINHVYWQMEVEIYDNDMKKIDAIIIEKFNAHQTSIPSGYCFVTYQQGKEDECLVIPNVIISSIPEYQPLVTEYEKKYKPTYLNAYINKGLILQTYQQSIKEQKKYQNTIND